LSKRPISLMLFGIAVLAAATPATAQDATAGAVVFKRCAICHSSDPAKGPKIGPALNNVVGRKAGKASGFAYSPAFAKSSIVWTTDKLDAFIERPSKVVPGNRMAFAGVADAKQRADLIAFLKTLRK
jgi:cytochrome c